jgi:hypothetical protein
LSEGETWFGLGAIALLIGGGFYGTQKAFFKSHQYSLGVDGVGNSIAQNLSLADAHVLFMPAWIAFLVSVILIAAAESVVCLVIWLKNR